MNSQLIEEAQKVISSPQVLINLVSQRVRQLSLGHRPMVDTMPHTRASDIALQEIIAGKIGFNEAGEDDSE